MKIAIVGGGEVGYEVARTLSVDDMDITVVDVDEERVLKVQKELDVRVVCGNGARPQILKEAGIYPGSDVDVLIACSGRDEVNILACQIARHCGVPHVITRAHGMEFTDSNEWAKDFGINVMISPERSVAREIQELLTVSSAVSADELLMGRGAIYAFYVAENSPLVGLSLRKVRELHPDLIAIVVYIQREDEPDTVPNGETVLRANDLCYVVTYKAQIWRLEELFQKKKSRPLKRVIICGGGKIGFQLAYRLKLNDPSMEIKLIDKDRAKCERLAKELSGVLVLCGDGADKKLLKNEGIDDVDGYVCATDSDEVNMLHCVVAKALGARKSIAVVGRKAYEDIWDRLDLDAIVDPNTALASVILRYVRYHSGIKSLSILGKIEAEMIEVAVSENSAVANRQLKDLSLPKGAIVALIERDKVFVPNGYSELLPGDNVVLFVENEISQKTANLFNEPN
ncbi:MAG: Trk system potassium transporter TrkA [Synergistaceae bacterium]|nr:Trk system potassium transporter TrkA [Synergistaceae bacterium]